MATIRRGDVCADCDSCCRIWTSMSVPVTGTDPQTGTLVAHSFLFFLHHKDLKHWFCSQSITRGSLPVSYQACFPQFSRGDVTKQ